MKKEQIEKILKELLDGSENSFIIATENGTGTCGSKADMLTQYILLGRSLNKILSKRVLKEAFELIFKSDDELLKELEKKKKENKDLNSLKKLLDSLDELLGDEDNE